MNEIERSLIEVRMESIATRTFLITLFQEVVRSEAVPRDRIRAALRRISRELTPPDDAAPDDELWETAREYYAETLDQLTSQVLAVVARAAQR